MIPQVDNVTFYRRRDGILYGVTPEAVEVPLVKFQRNFIDVEKLNTETIQYTNRYMAMWPDKWELINNEPKEENQLTLF